MRLWETRRHWNKFAKTDPLWAVMTAPDKAGNRWSTEEFFRTGRQEIAWVMEQVAARYPALRRGHALDFGCGPGRLTQALAEHFERVTGVDIAEPMLALAHEHNRHSDRITYVHNTRPDLTVFADGLFDFVLTVITLQHIEPEYSRRYLAEFMRILAPGGAAYFQVPYALPPARDEALRFSTWPPTLLRRIERITRRKVRRFLNRMLVLKPVMEMHALPREEVIAIVTIAGGEVIDVQDHVGAGDTCRSYAYLVRKR